MSPDPLSAVMPNDLEVVITRRFDAPPESVWAAWTDPALIPQWLYGLEGWSMPRCEVDLRPGGAWVFGYRKDTGATMQLSGTYREVDPPRRLVSTERWGPEWPETINTVVLTSEAAGTLLTLTITYPTKEARDAAMQTGALSGMELSCGRLDGLLAGLMAKG